MPLAANLSMLFHELPLIERPEAAAAAGFDAVEIQFPYGAEAADLAARCARAGVEMVLINMPPGDLKNGDVGLTCLTGREDEFRAALESCFDYAETLGVSYVNSLSGRPPAGEFEAATQTLIGNLRLAADRFAGIGVTVLVEPVNPGDVPGFLFNELEPALEAIAAVERENVKLLFDLYHMAQTEPSLPDAIRLAGSLIGHVQFADTPGRHQPGTGAIDFEGALKTLNEVGYSGRLSAEYWPTGPTAESLDWRADFGKWLE